MIKLMLLAGVLAAAADHPKVYETPADVARAKLNAARFRWAADFVAGQRARADAWAKMSDEQLRATVPPIGSVFAYGFPGCPACGAGWPTWGSGMASFDNPGHVTCPSCKRTFPDANYPDSGTGWRDPKTGKTYYLVGCYNAWAAGEITLRGLRALATSYAVTRDPKYAHAAAVLFDALADLYPTSTVGSIDYPDGAANSGRLERPQYQVARVLVYLVDYLDLFYDSPEFAAPSASGKGSIREHVEQDIIRNGGKYCYDMAVSGRMGLTNGQADYVRGALAAGIMLDEMPWIDCALNGPYSIYNFLDNCLDRDGQYYETSLGYSEHALLLYNDIAQMLANLRTPEHPNGINLYDHAKLRKAFFASFFDLDCFGHMPRFGDWGPDIEALKSYTAFIHTPYVFTECGYRYSTGDARSYWAAARDFVCGGDVEARRAASTWKNWLVFNAEPVTKRTASVDFEPHAVLGGRGIVTLRSGEGLSGRAALLRYGPSLNHGHLDDLNLNYFALGRELTYDLGYALGSADVQVGWARATASHNLVVVNERNQMLEPGGGGSAYFYVDRGPVRATEASSEASYSSEGVKTYRRTLASIDAVGGSYLVDIFRVAGGAKHDLMWHFFGKLGGVAGATLGPVQEKGSLAGPDYDWGKRIGPSGYIIGRGNQREYWNPPPGNGYGFLVDVRRATDLQPECKLTWNVSPDAKSKVFLTLLPDADCELVTAHAPGINPTTPGADYAILRRKGADLASVFVSVVEPSESSPVVLSTRRLKCNADGVVGIEIKTANSTDYVFSAISPKPAVFDTAAGKLKFDGRFGFVRVRDGSIARAVLVGGTVLGPVSSPSAEMTGKIVAVDHKQVKLTLDKAVGVDQSGVGFRPDAPDALIYLSRAGYSHSSPYRVISVDGNVVSLDGDLAIGRGVIGDAKQSAPDAIMNVTPLPRAIVVSRKVSGYYRGKRIVNDHTGAASTIIDVDADQRTIHVADPSKFAAGDSFTIYDVQPGDTFTIPSVVEK